MPITQNGKTTKWLAVFSKDESVKKCAKQPFFVAKGFFFNEAIKELMDNHDLTGVILNPYIDNYKIPKDLIMRYNSMKRQDLQHNGSTVIPQQSKTQITPQQIVQMAQTHEPASIYDTDGRHLLHEVELVVNRFIPLYTGIENVATSLMMHNPEEMMSKMNDADVDTLLVFFKFLAIKASEINNNQLISVIQNYLISIIQEKLSNVEKVVVLITQMHRTKKL